MPDTPPIIAAMQARYSCRNYLSNPIQAKHRIRLEEYMDSLPPGSFGYTARFKLIAASENDRRALRGLGTYGFIRGATGFIVGAIRVPAGDPERPHYLEDFGYQMEQVILQAASLGLGTCWLGGTFTKSSFARTIDLAEDELIPCVTAAGYPVGKPHLVEGLFRRKPRAERRKPWQELFFDGDFNQPLTQKAAGDYATPLEMVRIAPSASNRQPWRVVRQDENFHFYLQRTPGYREGMLVRLVTVADLQRIDLGIAMSHFELSARALGHDGEWHVQNPTQYTTFDEGLHYTATWAPPTPNPKSFEQ